MTAEDLAATKDSVMRHEGFGAHPYADLHGTQSIGYGRNLTTRGISKEEATQLLDHDLRDRVAALSAAWPPFLACDGPRQRVLIELAYQVGTDGLLLFRKMLHAVAVKDYHSAALEILNSRLEHQAPMRARDYADLLRTPVT